MENATHAIDTYVGIEDPADLGNYVDVSGKATNVRMPLSKTDIDSTTFGEGDMTNKSGLRDGSFSLDVFGDPDLEALMFRIFMSKDPVSVRYGPRGNGAGATRYTADHNMTGWEPGGAVNTLNGGPANFHRTGATTMDTF